MPIATLSTPNDAEAQKLERPASHLSRQDQDRLVEENLSVIGYQVTEVLRRVPTHVDRADLMSAGSLALVQAARTFDPSTGVPFRRYAANRIRGALIDELRSLDWATRGVRRRARQLENLSNTLAAQLGRQPTPSELAEVMGVGIKEVRSIKGDAERRLESIEAEPPGVWSLTDGGLTPQEHLLVTERLRYLDAGVDELPKNLRTVIVGLFFEDRAAADIADELDVTVSRVSQLRAQALGLLRDAMNTALDPDLAPTPSPAPGVAEKRKLAYYSAVATRASALATQSAIQAARAASEAA